MKNISEIMKEINLRVLYMLTLFLFLCCLIIYIIGESVLPKEVISSKKVDGSNNLSALYYSLPTSLINIQSTIKVVIYKNSSYKKEASILKQTFSLTAETVADPTELYSLNYKGFGFAADDVRFVINSKGLLKTVDVTVEDRIGEIISKLSEAPELIFGNNNEELKKRLLSGDVDTVTEYSADFQRKLEDLGKTIDWIVPINDETAQEQIISVDASFLISQIQEETNETTEPSDADDLSEVNGILTRPVTTVKLKIEPKADGFKTSEYSYLTAVDMNHLIGIPVSRSSFVKRKHLINLSDGLLSSHTINKPSSFEGIISIPIHVAKSIVSIPAQILSFKIDLSKKQKELLEAEKNRLEVQEQLHEMKKELEEMKQTIKEKPSAAGSGN